MGDNVNLIIWIFLALVVLFYFFVVFMSWRTWNPTHVVFLFLNFAGAIALVGFSSVALRAHTSWRERAQESEAQLAEEVQRQETLLHGDLLTSPQREVSIRSARAELDRIVQERGRVWRRCTPRQVTDEGVVVSTTPPGALEDEIRPHNITEKTVLYAFLELDAPEVGKVPMAFLGEFEATAVTETTVTLQPTYPLDDDQVSDIQRKGVTWVLYETMPIDGHEIFADLNEQQLRTLMPNRLQLPADRYERMIEDYLRHGQPAREDDPPESIWVRVKFLKPHKVDVDSDAAAGPLESDMFDAAGRALVQRLRKGEPVTFEAGDVAVFDLETAEPLIGEGTAAEVERIFVRPLHDYSHYFHEAYQRSVELDIDIRGFDRQIAALEDAVVKAKQQISYRVKEKGRLEQDLANLKTEVNEAIEYAQSLERRRDEDLNELSQLYRNNLLLAEELAALHQQVADEIERRTAEATAAARPTP